VKGTFGAPGEYVARVLAHDGSLDTPVDMSVNVMDASSSKQRLRSDTVCRAAEKLEEK
jgi:hypothetical protein